MKKFERNGKSYWTWEPHEGEARERFEAALSCDDVVDVAMNALLEAMQKAAASKKTAWRAFHETTGGLTENIYAYNWLSGEFYVADKETRPE